MVQDIITDHFLKSPPFCYLMSHDASWGIVAKLGTRAIQRRRLHAHAMYGCWIMHEITLIGWPVTCGRDYLPITSACGNGPNGRSPLQIQQETQHWCKDSTTFRWYSLTWRMDQTRSIRHFHNQQKNTSPDSARGGCVSFSARPHGLTQNLSLEKWNFVPSTPRTLQA